MDIKQAIMERKSVRGFKKDPVSQEILRDVLQTAVRAVSATNAQPWEFAVVTGETLDLLREENIKRLRSGAPLDYPDFIYEGKYRERGKALGKQLFAALGIERDDKERRVWWRERGFRFFDAPAVIFLYIDKSLDERLHRFDMGCVAQNICLAAMSHGLGTCVADQCINYNDATYTILNIPRDKRFVTGIVIGYPDPTFPANQVVSTREAVDDITLWVGF